MTLDPSITQAFTDGATLIGLLAAAAVGLLVVGLGVRVGIKWLRQTINKA